MSSRLHSYFPGGGGGGGGVEVLNIKLFSGLKETGVVGFQYDKCLIRQMQNIKCLMCCAKSV